MAMTAEGHPVARAEQFQLITLLGRGSYGSVYKAKNTDTGDFVAIKVIPTSLADSGAAATVRKEIEILKDCNHPNVVRYHGSFQALDSLCIVMEYCGGGSVSDIMHANGKNLTEEQIRYIIYESFKGIAYLHSIGRIHRDIKCGNILLTEDGRVKLADFGVSAELSSTMTKRNTFIGTPHWMAPEVIQESRYDGKVDVWGLGICVIEMAEREPPRWDVHPMKVIFLISKDEPPSFKDRDKWGRTMHNFVQQCLTKDPRKRPTASSMLQHRFLAGTDKDAPTIRGKLRPLITTCSKALNAKPLPSQVASGLLGNVLSNAESAPRASGTVLVEDNTTSFGDAGAGAARARRAGGGPTHARHGTMVQHDGTVVAPGGTVAASVSSGGEGGGDYFAAISAAAAERESEPFKKAADKRAKEQMSKTRQQRDHLRAIYERGGVISIPFLRAREVPPLALLGWGTAGAVGPGGAAGAPFALELGTLMDAVEMDEEAGGRSDSRSVSSLGGGTHQSDAAGGAKRPLPAKVVRQLQANPALLNLARALAYKRRIVADLPLPPDQVRSVSDQAADIADTLRVALSTQ
ncbi:unnamed protein product [Pedinophyceae sp. YPF-701]|nr:unnamed protein product [Pedinophyceae sp. YPF-701]